MLKDTHQKKTATPVKRPPPPRTRIVKPSADLPLVDAPKLQPARLIYKPEVCDRVGLTYVSIWRMMTRSEFPLSREIGKGKVAWLAAEIDEWIATRPVRKIKKMEG